MAQITIGATDVRVARGTSYEIQPHGDQGRAFSGKMRSDIRAYHRVFRVSTPEIDKSDADTLRDLLKVSVPLTVSGDMIGGSASFHARGIQMQPVTADDWIVSFELHETNDFS